MIDPYKPTPSLRRRVTTQWFGFDKHWEAMQWRRWAIKTRSPEKRAEYLRYQGMIIASNRRKYPCQLP